MADEEKRISKRSRFDQTEPEPKRSSRFDRRSRSPSNRHSESHRSRSPVNRNENGTESRKSGGADAAAAAAAAAARINAQIQAKKGIQHVDVPPIRSTPTPIAKSSSPSANSPSANEMKTDMYIADGDYIKDIEVNDLRNKYTLTKGATQKTNPPLYLHITSTTKEGLEQAVQKIEDLMKQELPNLVDERRFRRREPEQFERDEFGRRKWPEERIPINLEPLPGFNLRAQVVGGGGAYVKHIQQETRCRVQIKGQGSSFMEHSTNQESDDPMYLHVAGPDPKEVQRAKGLCEDLLKNVREQWQRHKDNPRSYNGYGDRQNSQGYGGYGSSYGSSYSGHGGYGASYGQSSTTSAQSPIAAPGTSSAGSSSQQDYSAQWAQYFQQYPQYAAYYYAQQQQQATPAPPGGSSDPPPPPPGGSPGVGYNAVPPPPGM
ncbi:MAG: hypothetical protein LQ340_001922 [Diploschistes diacapsis]|nr:MAG: hypothetical protein LQ340_001922 [Diploschistes diacapsis]